MDKLLETDQIVAVAIETPATPLRDRARSLVRATMRSLLADKLGAAEETIQLISRPGQPIRLAPPWSHVGLSVSHEAGRSVMAIHLGGAIGIDLLRLGAPVPDIPALSGDYLGPVASAALNAQAGDRQQIEFARAWCRFEAKLKCLGLPLSEWTPALENRLAACSLTDLPMPPGWAAAIATTRERC